MTEHPALGRWIRGRWPAFALVGLVLAAATVRIVLVRGMEAPVILCDEFIYSNVAKNLAEHGRYSLRGVPSHSSYLYPLLIAPAWLFDSMATTYALAKSIGAASMTLVAIPTYLWARRLVGPWHSLLAAALTLLLPAFFYAGLLMTEAAFLPAFVLVGFAIAAMLERPTLVNQLGALAALVLAISIRFQGIVLVAVIPTAVLLKVVLDWRAGVTRDRVVADLRRLWPTAVALVGAGALYVRLQGGARRGPLDRARRLSGVGPAPLPARAECEVVRETSRRARARARVCPRRRADRSPLVGVRQRFGIERRAVLSGRRLGDRQSGYSRRSAHSLRRWLRSFSSGTRSTSNHFS